ncbi:hypothetical protein [Hyalangium versicolor]|uniref:hypothetical protein n=1 Tax=Hyalangium versicolor TaxID=2861190 RepID=UPI001CCED032|nr:hypothetical protein [Hyalangium versicolor]
MSIYILTLPRPWPWAVLERGCRVLFFTYTEAGRPHALRPPVEALGRYVALHVGSTWDVEGAAFMERRLGLYVPAEDGLPAGSIFAVARLAEVTTICNDSRAFRGEPWWRGTIGWWFEAVLPVEPLECPEATPFSLLAEDFRPELRERFTLARDGVWRPDRVQRAPRPETPRQQGSGQFDLGL